MNEESLDDKPSAAQQSHVFRPATLPQTADGNDNGKDDYMALALRQLVTAAEADGYRVRYAVEVIDTDGKRKVYSSDTKGRVRVNGTARAVPNMALSLVDFDQSSQTMEQCTLKNKNNPSSNQHPTATSKQHGRRLPYKKRLLMELASSSSPFVPDKQQQRQPHDILHSNRQPARNTAPRRVSIETTTSSSSTIGFAPSCRSHDRTTVSMDAAALGFNSCRDTFDTTISSSETPLVSRKEDRAVADANEQTRNNNMCSHKGSPTERPVHAIPITEVSFQHSSRRASVDTVLSSSSAAPSEKVIATNMPWSKRGGSQTHPSTQNKKRRVSIPAAQQPLNTTPAVSSSSTTKKLNWEPPPNSEGSVESRVSSLSSAATGSFDSELEPGEIVPTSVGATNELLSIPRRRAYCSLVDRPGIADFTGRRPTDMGELLEHRNAMHRCMRRYLLPSEFGVDLFESAMIRMGNGRGLSNYPIEFARCSVRLCGAALNGSTHADDDNALFLELTTNSKNASETIRRCCREIDKVLFTESKGHRDYLMYRLAALNRKPGTVYEDGSVISIGQKRLDFSSDLWYMTCVDLLCDRKAPMVDDIIEIQKKHPSCKVHLRNTHCKAYPRIQPHVIVASPIQHIMQKVQQCRKDVVDLIASS
ncbi:expressed unknown protein [Seminavis robusta]|uniref:Uncharacterized protein n=1 Tax=Seminavis robusta TaxID=568900 RepID=A0A9N8HIH2_9STRA|nr:expressed unknown protein [Seminavis robusta]|eukprot:Sro594_g172530.1 n/a (647) ;mRNA; f:46370-48310